MRTFTLALLIGLLGLAACSQTQTSTPKAEALQCTVAYRPNVQQGIESEETLSFTDVDAELSLGFTEAVLNAAYSAGVANNERNLRVWVTNPDGTRVYHSTLFQFEVNAGPQNQFVGGHGFTGLNYHYPPDSEAEIQYWCEVTN